MFYRFADPGFLALLALVPLFVWWYVRRQSRRGASLRFSSLAPVRAAAPAGAGRWRHLLIALRALGLALLIVAFARPQSGVTGENVLTQGIDIVLAVDLSSSMLAEDLEPNRLEAAKAVAADFVRGRRNDRIGLVVFAADAYTQAPLTLDYDVITSLLAGLEVGLVEDGTAIGMGIAAGVKRLEDSDAESKVLIVLTDGRNNRGAIDPVTAAQAAQALGIRIYTIGAGTTGEAPYPVDDPRFGRRYVPIRVDIDETTLRETAELTGGRYFRATDRESLAAIYDEIDKLETTEIEVQQFTRYGELFHYPLLLGMLVVLVEATLAHTRLQKIP